VPMAAILRTLERRAAFDPEALRASVERRFGGRSVAERLLATYREMLEAARLQPGGTAASWPDVGGMSPEAPVVIGLDRARVAARITSLPPAVRKGLDVVTERRPADARIEGVARITEVTTDVTAPPPGTSGLPRPIARLVRLARDPVGTVRRRLGRDHGSAGALEPARVAVQHLLAERPGRPVLGLDGHDILAVASLAESGSTSVRPAGLRRLADAVAGPHTAEPGPSSVEINPPTSER